MLGTKKVYSFHVPGTLAADLAIKFKAPQDMSLEHVSAVSSANSNTKIKIGTSADDDAYFLLAEAGVGKSGTPAEIGRADFVGGQYPHIAKGTTFTVDVDYDGAGGTAGANFTLVLTFSEG